MCFMALRVRNDYNYCSLALLRLRIGVCESGIERQNQGRRKRWKWREKRETEKEWKREINCYNEALVSALISSFGGIEKSNQFLPDILC